MSDGDGTKYQSTADEGTPLNAEIDPYLAGQGHTSDSDAGIDEVDEFLKQWEMNEKQKALLRWFDKVAFTLGVANIVLLAFGVFNYEYGAPFLMIFFTLKMFTLFPLRFKQYRSLGYAYFMLDFCYFANLGCALYIWVFPWSSKMFITMYAAAHAPLAGAVYIFRNSLVFHDVEKITSCFIHVSPALVMYALRWHMNEKTGEATLRGFPTPFTIFDKDATGAVVYPAVYEWVLYCTGFFAAHQAVYAFIVNVVSKYFPGLFSVYHDRNQLTSYRYVTRDKKSPARKIVSYFGKKYRVLMWFVLNITYAGLLACFCALWARSQVANIIFLTLVCWVAVFNGSSFYFEVMTRKYENRRATVAVPKRMQKGAGNA